MSNKSDSVLPLQYLCITFVVLSKHVGGGSSGDEYAVTSRSNSWKVTFWSREPSVCVKSKHFRTLLFQNPEMGVESLLKSSHTTQLSSVSWRMMETIMNIEWRNAELGCLLPLSPSCSCWATHGNTWTGLVSSCDQHVGGLCRPEMET